jgi:hypothetical protein
MPNKVRKKISDDIKMKFNGLGKQKKLEPNQYSSPARYRQIKNIKKRNKNIMADLDNS